MIQPVRTGSDYITSHQQMSLLYPWYPYSIKDNYRAACDLMGIYYTLYPGYTLRAQINMGIKPMIIEIMVCSSFLPFTLRYHLVLLTTWT